MTRTHRIHRTALALLLASALLATPAAATPASGSPTVPTSAFNARWPSEPAGGPLPVTTAAPAPPAPRESHKLTLVWVATGLVLLVLCTGVATGVPLRPGARRRVTA
jgi:hypothetical protein